VPIYREEIWLAVKEENRAAAASTDALPAASSGAPAAQHPPGADASPVPTAEEAGSGAAE